MNNFISEINLQTTFNVHDNVYFCIYTCTACTAVHTYTCTALYLRYAIFRLCLVNNFFYSEHLRDIISGGIEQICINRKTSIATELKQKLFSTMCISSFWVPSPTELCQNILRCSVSVRFDMPYKVTSYPYV